MDRLLRVPNIWVAKVWRLLIVMLCCLSLFTSGCTTIATLAYVLNPNDVPAAYDGLAGKRIAVVCRPVVELSYANANVPRDLAKMVGMLLGKNVKKADIIDQSEVAEWTDENDWNEYTQIGQALDADMVVAIDMEQFTIHQGPTLYQGRAQIHLAVFDIKNGKKEVFTKQLPESVYPPNTGIPSSEKNEAEFRFQYLGVLSQQIARHFYAHESRVDFASDSTAL